MTKDFSKGVDNRSPERKAWFAETMKKLDERTARGIPPTHVQSPSGVYLSASTREDAEMIAIGRPDLRTF